MYILQGKEESDQALINDKNVDYVSGRYYLNHDKHGCVCKMGYNTLYYIQRRNQLEAPKIYREGSIGIAIDIYYNKPEYTDIEGIKSDFRKIVDAANESNEQFVNLSDFKTSMDLHNEKVAADASASDDSDDDGSDDAE